ncbi:MAG: hypothetical protein JW749_07880 [Sedimentisphaerales bacterium]|nr:hypothetical protein [Sedimentisphaerales bacterium]
MFKIKPQKTRMKGSLMGIVLLICLICAIVGTGLLALAFHSRMLGIRAGDEITARLAADAAVANAIFQLNEKLKVKPWDDSSLPTASTVSLLNSDATFDYTVSNAGGVYTITGTGRGVRTSRVVESTLRLYSPFDYAVLTRSSLELKSSATVDWYNNQADDWPLQIGTTSTASGAITLLSNTTVNGDIVVGAGGDPASVISSSGTITGNIYPMISNPELPTITVPDWLAAMSSGGVIKKESSFVTGKFSGMTLGTNDTITITEPIVLYITGDITLGNSAIIEIGGATDTDNNASLIIYLAGNLEGKYSSGFNNLTMDAKRLYIYGLDSCTSIALKNSADFRGAIYAPNAAVDLDNSGNIYGSVVSDSFVLRNSAVVYYDANLRDRTVNDEAVRFVIHRWSER